MRIIIKKLHGEEYLLEVQPTMTVADIKQQISKKFRIPVNNQMLLLLGKKLVDNQTVASCPSLKDGSKIYLVIKKPLTYHEILVKRFRSHGYDHSNAVSMANKTVDLIRAKINSMSWDDLDRLCLSLLMEERREKLLANRNQRENTNM